MVPGVEWIGKTKNGKQFTRFKPMPEKDFHILDFKPAGIFEVKCDHCYQQEREARKKTEEAERIYARNNIKSEIHICSLEGHVECKWKRPFVEIDPATALYHCNAWNKEETEYRPGYCQHRVSATLTVTSTNIYRIIAGVCPTCGGDAVICGFITIGSETSSGRYCNRCHKEWKVDEKGIAIH